MKVLIVHNYYREPGGEDATVESETRLLEENGHQVIHFTGDNASIRSGISSGLASLWNRRSYRSLREMIRAQRPDLAHIHNTFHAISPAAYWAATREATPVVATLHNYRLLCCNALLLRDGRPCEKCIGTQTGWSGVAHACYRESRPASLALTAVTRFHGAIGTWRNHVDLYVAPSEFLKSKFVAGGFAKERIVVKPHFVNPDPGVGPGDGGYALFVGRLSSEKGVRTLVSAWHHLASELPLLVVGDGPLSGIVARAVRPGCVEWLGRRRAQEVYDLIGRARCVVVPSECYESFSRVVIEAFAKGTPVVVSTPGAAASLVRDGVNGLHFQSGKPCSLVKVMRDFLLRGARVSEMRRRAREEYERKYASAENLGRLLAIYEYACSLHGKEADKRSG